MTTKILKAIKCHPSRQEKSYGYVQWHAWAEEQIKKGRKQVQCKTCGLWYFK